MAKAASAFGPAGKRLITAVTAEWALDVHERELLNQAAHCLDTQAELQQVIDRDGAMVRKDFKGPLRPNPALAELRAQKNVYVRLLQALGLPRGVAAEKHSRATKFEMKLRGLPGGSA